VFVILVLLCQKRDEKNLWVFNLHDLPGAA